LEALEDQAFDRVFVMARSHLRWVEAWPAELLSSLCNRESDVADPFGGGLSEYQAAFEEIRLYLDALGGADCEDGAYEFG